jgi:ABC-type Mn2+/Zn2+ transport system ATPase subunit
MLGKAEIGLIGVNGTGKSCFIKYICRLKIRTRWRGSISVKRFKIGFLGQNPVFIEEKQCLTMFSYQ